MPNWKDHIRKHLAILNLTHIREQEIVEELSQHADDRYRELLNNGVAEAEARQMVLDELTGHELLAQQLRSIEDIEVAAPVVLGAGKGHLLTGLRQDLRYGLRSLRKNPRFTTVAILALALGIGANTSIFSVVNGVLLQPLAYPDADRLMRIYETTNDFSSSSVAYPNYLDWRHENHSFVDMGAYTGNAFNFTGSGEPEQLTGFYISASLFPTLGVTPFLGRNFLPKEDRPNVACSVILSYGLWRRRFASDTNILGRRLTLNASTCSVIGVMPWNFRLGEEDQVYLPIEQWNSVELRTRETHPGIRVIGRLKPGLSPQVVQADIASICSRLARQYPATNASHSARVVHMKEDMVGSIRPTLLMLAGAVGFVLLIACANVANLLLARSVARKREFAIRAALGADRWRVVRQLLAESVLLSLAAALMGLLIARWGTRLVLAAAPGSVPRTEEIGIDGNVLLFSLVVAVVTGILFGLAPALQGANVNPQESLKDGTSGAGGGRRRSEGIFVAVEIALALILLAGACLMIQSVWRLLQVNPGFNVRNLLTMQVALSPRVMASPPQVQLAYRQMLNRVASVPGVQAAAITSLVPLSDSDSEIPFWPGTGPQPPQEQMRSALFYITTSDYSRVLQLPLRRGRFFTDRDNAASPPVVVIDEVVAKRLFPDQDAVGRQISLLILGPVQIVGVVGHAKHWGLDSDDTNKIREQIYFPLQQVPDQFMSEGITGLTLGIRTVSDPFSVLQAVRAQVAGPTRDQPIYGVRTMEQTISRSLAERRFTMLVLFIFACAALLLAAVGIYGVTSYAVSRRIHELGIRAALGASRNEMIAMVLRQGMRPALIGMLAGLAASVAVTRFMTSLLYDVHPADPATLIGVALLLACIALLACYIPARTATAVDPVVALRWE